MPGTISPFAYNETVAQEYYPINKEDAGQLGFYWRSTPEKKTVPATQEVPDSIEDVQDNITDETLLCVQCSKNYRIIPHELRFYRKIGVPVPRACPECRHKNRLDLRNPRVMFEGTCAKCSKEIQTSYSPERPEKVFCEECYMKEVY